MPQGGGVLTGPGPGYQLRPPGRFDDDTGTLGPTGDLDAPGDSAGWAVLWPDSMHLLDYPEDIDDEPGEPPPGTLEAFFEWLGDPLTDP